MMIRYRAVVHCERRAMMEDVPVIPVPEDEDEDDVDEDDADEDDDDVPVLEDVPYEVAIPVST